MDVILNQQKEIRKEIKLKQTEVKSNGEYIAYLKYYRDD